MGLSNHENAFRIQQMMLMVAGIWPKKNSTLLYKLQGFSSFSIMVGFATSLFLSVVFIKEYAPLIKSWAMFVSILNCCIKFGLFYFKVPSLVELLKFLRSPHFHYYDEDLDVHIQSAIRTATIMVKVFLGSAICTVISLALAPTASPNQRQLPLPFPFDMNGKPLPLYLSVYIFQTIALLTAAWTSTGFDNVATSMMRLSSGYFKILKITIQRTTNFRMLLEESDNCSENTDNLYERFDEEINSRLSVCVEHHLAVIKFTESVESIFTYIVLLQFLASAVGICLAGFTFTSAPVGSIEFAFALSLPITLIIQISFYCTFGNEVTLQSNKIIEACYMTEWVYCGPLVRKTLFIIMERSKRPLILTAGKFINLSLSSLAAVFKSAISYGAVLRQLTNKE